MAGPGAAMGLAPGGRMRQAIYDDPFDLEDWDVEHSSRCFVAIANSLTWRAVTGEASPILPPTAADYAAAGLPWFETYASDAAALKGSADLAGMKGVAALGAEKGQSPLPENQSVDALNLVGLGTRRPAHRVREGTF